MPAMAASSFRSKTSVLLDVPPPPSRWADRIVLIPTCVEDQASILSVLDLFSRVPDALGDRDCKIVRKNAKGSHSFAISNVIKSEHGQDLDLRVAVCPSGSGPVRIRQISLMTGHSIYAQLDIYEIDLLAEGAMLSDALRGLLRTFVPIPVDALAILSANSDGLPLDKALLNLIDHTAASMCPMRDDSDSETRPVNVYTTRLATKLEIYVSGFTPRIDLAGRPRIDFKREYGISERPVDTAAVQQAVDTLTEPFGLFAFVSPMLTTNIVCLKGSNSLDDPFGRRDKEPMAAMRAVAALNTISRSIHEDLQ